MASRDFEAAMRANLTLCALAHGAWHMYEMALPPIYPSLMRELSLSYTQVGLLVSTFAALRVSLELPMGHLSDKRGCKPFVSLFMLIYAIGIVGVSLARDYWQLLLSIAAAGIGASAYHPGGTALTAKSFPKGRGRAMGLSIASGPAGSMIGPLLLGVFGAVMGWRDALRILAIPGIAIAILFWRLAVEPGIGSGGDPSGRKSSDLPKERGPILRHFSIPIALALAVSAMRGVYWNGFNSFFPTYLRNYRAFDQSSVAYIFSAIMGASAIGIAIGGFASDRIGRRKVVLLSAAIPAILIPSILPAGDYMVPILAVAAGLSSSLEGAALTALIADLSPPEVLGKIFALNFSIQAAIGALVTPLIFGWLADAIGLWAIFPATAASCVAMIALTLMIRRERRE
ncbi:MAG: MFS transporter [Candidatus Bathyarchaeia archaeon]